MVCPLRLVHANRTRGAAALPPNPPEQTTRGPHASAATAPQPPQRAGLEHVALLAAFAGAGGADSVLSYPLQGVLRAVYGERADMRRRVGSGVYVWLLDCDLRSVDRPIAVRTKAVCLTESVG